jgi:hypothetical protein
LACSQDLQSANLLEVSAALSAACKVLTADMIPAVLPLVLELMKHDQYVDSIISTVLFMLRIFKGPEKKGLLGFREMPHHDPPLYGTTP